MSMSDFSSFSFSPMPNSRLPHDFPPYIGVKTEMDFVLDSCNNFTHSQDRMQSYPPSPHGLSSCMYAAPVSPCLTQQGSPDYYVSIPSSSKENGGFRNTPSCRRRLDFNHNAFVHVTKVSPVAVAKRNERERNRVKLINMTFQTLRQHLPLKSGRSKGKSRKLSKVQTLRSAIDYIRQLQGMIHTRKHQQQQHQQLTQQRTHDVSTKLFNTEAQNQTFCRQNDTNIRSLDKRQNITGSFPCQTTCHGLASSCSIDELNNEVVTSPSLQGDLMSSSPMTNSNVESPYSDASSYDVVNTEEDEFIDFDEWF